MVVFPLTNNRNGPFCSERILINVSAADSPDHLDANRVVVNYSGTICINYERFPLQLLAQHQVLVNHLEHLHRGFRAGA